MHSKSLVLEPVSVSQELATGETPCATGIGHGEDVGVSGGCRARAPELGGEPSSHRSVSPGLTKLNTVTGSEGQIFKGPRSLFCRADSEGSIWS